MTEFFLCLIIKENDPLPDCLKNLNLNVVHRQKSHSHFKVNLSISESDLLSQQLRLTNVDFALIPSHVLNSQKKLVVFDMDSTLIENEVIDEMAALFGKGDAVKIITEKTMNGELNFDEALKERVALLKGLTREELTRVLNKLKVTQGVPELIIILKKYNIKTAILSGGFQFFADHFKTLLNMDYAFANELEFENNKLTGNVLGVIVNGQRKAELLEEIALKENASLLETIAIGDGANDLPMLHKAGIGFAFHAKDKVRKEVKHQVNFGSMKIISNYLNLD